MRKTTRSILLLLCIVAFMSVDGMASSNTYESEYYVYARPGGKYYHVDASCSGMKNASVYALLDMIEEGKPACPICCWDADRIVYGKSGNPYYHSYSGCLGIKYAYSGTLAKALAFGLKKCPKCWKD